jgi:hypothetical protein
MISTYFSGLEASAVEASAALIFHESFRGRAELQNANRARAKKFGRVQQSRTAIFHLARNRSSGITQNRPMAIT